MALRNVNWYLKIQKVLVYGTVQRGHSTPSFSLARKRFLNLVKFCLEDGANRSLRSVGAHPPQYTAM
jgi:hypothetical protein